MIENVTATIEELTLKQESHGSYATAVGRVVINLN